MGKLVHDEDAYRRLSGGAGIDYDGFFPAYRALDRPRYACRSAEPAARDTTRGRPEGRTGTAPALDEDAQHPSLRVARRSGRAVPANLLATAARLSA